MTDATQTTTTTIAGIAGTADEVVKQIAKVEPTIAGIAGVFVPGINLAQPFIPAILAAADRALGDIAAGNNGDLFQAFLELLNHMTAGRTAAPALAPTATSSPAVIQSTTAAAASTTQANNFQAPTG